VGCWHEEDEQNMALLLVFLCTVLASSCLGSDALVGGIQERKTDDPEVLDALDFAMNEFNAMQNNLYRLMATKVSDATFQVSITLKRYRKTRFRDCILFNISLKLLLLVNIDDHGTAGAGFEAEYTRRPGVMKSSCGKNSLRGNFERSIEGTMSF